MPDPIRIRPSDHEIPINTEISAEVVGIVTVSDNLELGLADNPQNKNVFFRVAAYVGVMAYNYLTDGEDFWWISSSWFGSKSHIERVVRDAQFIWDLEVEAIKKAIKELDL